MRPRPDRFDIFSTQPTRRFLYTGNGAHRLVIFIVDNNAEIVYENRFRAEIITSTYYVPEV